MAKSVDIEEYALSRSRRNSFWKRYGGAAFFLLPYLFFFALFTVYPLIYGILMSLMKFNVADASQNEWRGFQNYYNILFNPNNTYFKSFWWSMRNTLLFSLVLVPLGVIFPLIFAVLINFEPKGYKLFRAIIYLPSILPVTASGVIFSAFILQELRLRQSMDRSDSRLAWDARYRLVRHHFALPLGRVGRQFHHSFSRTEKC